MSPPPRSRNKKGQWGPGGCQKHPAPEPTVKSALNFNSAPSAPEINAFLDQDLHRFSKYLPVLISIFDAG
eukprot:1161704-Pelagomonas_calceolata.AAC.3